MEALEVRPLAPEAVLPSPDGRPRWKSKGALQNGSSHDHPRRGPHEQEEEEEDEAGNGQFVYLKSTWVFSSLRHPLWRLAICSLRIALCFIASVTSPLVNSHHTPAYFPVYGDLLGLLVTNVTVAKLVFHGVVSVVVLALIRLVVYPLWFDDRWNWLRQYRLARQTFTRLSRASSATQLVRTAASSDRAHGEATITLRVYEARTNEAPTARARVHTAPRAQGSWTLMALLYPVLWYGLVSALRPIVIGTDYDEMLFGKSGQANELPQWRLQLILSNVLMALHTVSWLLTLDGVLQDTRHSKGVWRSLRRGYSACSVFRILCCWAALAAILVGGLYFEVFTLLWSWCLESWSTQARHSSSIITKLTSEAWRCVLSSIVVVLDLLWLVQDWHFPGFATSVGSKIFGLHRDFLAIPLPGGKRVYLTSKWTSCFVVLGLLLPLDFCKFYQDYTYSPPAYSQIVTITAGYRVFPSIVPITDELDVITQLSKEGSIGRFFMQSRLDRVPAVICVGMMSALILWLQSREQWRLCYAAFLGQPKHFDQAITRAKINAAAPKSTREALKDRMRLFNLYRVRSQYDLLGSGLALVSVGSVIFQVRSIWRATSISPDIQDTAGETYGVLLLLISIALAYQLYYRYAIKYEILVIRKQIPTSSYQSWWRGTPRSLLLYPFIAELVLSGLCLPPFLHGDIGFDESRYSVMLSSSRVNGIACPSRMVAGGVDDEGYASCDLEYSYPVEVLNLFVLVRLYWLVRLLRNELFRHMFSDHAALLVTAGIGGNVPSEISSLRWSFRMCLSLIPGRIIFGIFLMLWTITAAAVSILERPFPSLLDNEEHSLWLTIVTISAVGYGDAYPLTAFGRLSIILGAVIGGAVVVSLMTSIFLDTLKGSKDEHKFVQELERIMWDKELQHRSATLIAAAWKAHQQRQQGRSKADAVFHLAHEFNAARKRYRPKETFETVEQLRISSIAKWRTQQLCEWTESTSIHRTQLVDLIEREVAALETAIQPLVA